jgi:hypothetical protein
LSRSPPIGIKKLTSAAGHPGQIIHSAQVDLVLLVNVVYLPTVHASFFMKGKFDQIQTKEKKEKTLETKQDYIAMIPFHLPDYFLTYG